MRTSTNHADQLLTHAGFLRALAARLAGGDADDLQQATLITALQRPPVRAGNERGWLATIAANLWRNEARDRARRRAHESARSPHEPVPSPAEIAAREDVRRRVVDAVVQLPEPLRQVVVLRYYEGLESAAIGRLLGLAPSTVRTRLQQAIGQLRVRLDAEHGSSRAAWTTPLLGWLHAAPTAAPFAVPHRAVLATLAAVATVLVALGLRTWLADDAPPATAAQARGPATAVAETAVAPPPATRVDGRSTTDAPAPLDPAAELVWQPPPGALHGVVLRAESEAPLPDTNVTTRRVQAPCSPFAPLLDSPAAERCAVTGPDGSFRFDDLPVGDYDVDADGPDGQHAWLRVAVGETPRHVRLLTAEDDARGDLAVRVLDTGNRGVVARVTAAFASSRGGCFGFADRPPLQGDTDRDGWFVLRGRTDLAPIGRGVVLARTADGRAGIAKLAAASDATGANSTVLVEPTATIVGRLGGLASYAGVGIVAHPDATLALGPECFEVIGDVAADGSFRITDLPAGDYKLQVTGLARRADNEQFWNLPATTVTGGAIATSVPPTIPCLAGARIRGVVRDPDNRPIPGARATAVRAWFNNKIDRLLHHRERENARWFRRVFATTDAQGTYEMSLEPGVWQLVVVAPGRAMDVEMDLAIGDAPQVELAHTLVADGAIAVNTIGHLVLRHEREPELRHTIADGGVVELRGLRPGPWELGTHERREFTSLASCVVVAGETTWVDLARGEPRVHRGQLLHQGRPLADHEVRIDGGAPVSTAADGSFELAHTHLPDDRVVLSVRWRGVRITGTAQLDGAIELDGRVIDVETVAADGTPTPATLEFGATYDGGGRRYEVHRSRGTIETPDGHLRILLCDLGWWSSVVATFADGSRTRARIGDATRLRLEHRPAGAIAVRTLDRNGLPVPGQRVTALTWGHDRPAPASAETFANECADADEIVVGETDARGEARLPGALPGPTLLRVWHAGTTTATVRVVAVDAGATTPVELVLGT